MFRDNAPKPAKYTFTELLFPERPQQLWKKARASAKKRLGKVRHIGPASALNAAYVRWLARESMLQNAEKHALKYSGRAAMWRKPYAKPRPRAAIKLGSVWYTAYPASIIAPRHSSILETLGDDALWETFQQIGITGMHTGPMKIAGGLDGWDSTPTVDGHFDRISNKIDPLFGTDEEFRHLAEIAAPHGGIIIDDIVPGHTGKGPDFRLAEMNYMTYPGIYHMVEIHPKDWHLLPAVKKGRDSTNLSPEQEAAVQEAGYIIGKLYRVIFYDPGIKETSWSATKAVTGVDGVKRRWVYLHHFKEGQPSINWLDPSFAGMQLVIGDGLHSIDELGARGLRLDANGLLGIEKGEEGEPAWSEGHPLSEAANHLLASMIRKVGGFTFQELNMPLDDMKAASANGADLSYDFITRPAYQHALIKQDTEFLRLMLRTALEMDINTGSLIHAMQNHDELTYELVHFWSVHKDDEYTYEGKSIRGGELRLKVRAEILDTITGKNAPYNQPYTENGIACTTASVITAALGHRDLSGLTPENVGQIKQAHLLLAMFNALQPGVFALSGWDLVGALTLDPDSIKDLLVTGDTRWLNRGAYDLMGKDPAAKRSQAGMPKAQSLYGALPGQLADPDSFASQLRRILEVRERYGIALGHVLDIPDVSEKALLVMIHRLNKTQLQVTALNFSAEPLTGGVISQHLPPSAPVIDMFTEKELTKINHTHGFTISLAPFQGTSLLIPIEENKF